MPPNAKFTKEEIIQAAAEIAETSGIQTLTARNLGGKLGSSARPIFTVFRNMNEVVTAVEEYAHGVYERYVNAGLEEPLPFKGVGRHYINFAAERPKLFELLFMKEQERMPNSVSVLPAIETSYHRIIRSITESYSLSDETAQKLYLHMWIYTHGIAVLIATKMCEFTDGQISQMLTDVFTSLLIRVKKGELK